MPVNHVGAVTSTIQDYKIVGGVKMAGDGCVQEQNGTTDTLLYIPLVLLDKYILCEGKANNAERFFFPFFFRMNTVKFGLNNLESGNTTPIFPLV